jgi:hypothetical protein
VINRKTSRDLPKEVDLENEGDKTSSWSLLTFLSYNVCVIGNWTVFFIPTGMLDKRSSFCCQNNDLLFLQQLEKAWWDHRVRILLQNRPTENRRLHFIECSLNEVQVYYYHVDVLNYDVGNSARLAILTNRNSKLEMLQMWTYCFRFVRCSFSSKNKQTKPCCFLKLIRVKLNFWERLFTQWKTGNTLSDTNSNAPRWRQKAAALYLWSTSYKSHDIIRRKNYPFRNGF